MEEKRQRVEERRKLMPTTTTERAVEKAKETIGAKAIQKKDGSSTASQQEHGSDTKAELKQPQLKIEVHATATHHEAEQHLEPKVAHAQNHEFSHSQAVSTVQYAYVS